MGGDSALFHNRCLGEFPHSSDSEGLVPLSWVEAAIERWEANNGQPPSDHSIASVLTSPGWDWTRPVWRFSTVIGSWRFG